MSGWQKLLLVLMILLFLGYCMNSTSHTHSDKNNYFGTYYFQLSLESCDTGIGLVYPPVFLGSYNFKSNNKVLITSNWNVGSYGECISGGGPFNTSESNYYVNGDSVFIEDKYRGEFRGDHFYSIPSSNRLRNFYRQ